MYIKSQNFIMREMEDTPTINIDSLSSSNFDQVLLVLWLILLVWLLTPETTALYWWLWYLMRWLWLTVTDQVSSSLLGCHRARVLCHTSRVTWPHHTLSQAMSHTCVTHMQQPSRYLLLLDSYLLLLEVLWTLLSIVEHY